MVRVCPRIAVSEGDDPWYGRPPKGPPLSGASRQLAGFRCERAPPQCGPLQYRWERHAGEGGLLARTAHWPRRSAIVTMRRMQVITPRVPGHDRRTIVVGTLVGAVLLVGGLAIAWLAFGTPFIQRFTPSGRPATSQVVVGMLAWAFALIAPATFIIVGIARIVAVFDSVAAPRPRRTPPSRRNKERGA